MGTLIISSNQEACWWVVASEMCVCVVCGVIHKWLHKWRDGRENVHGKKE